jgi:LacI family transcriptional regulator
MMSDATIRDVARHAEVSVATVSRALNGLDNVREQTKQRIMDAAKSLGYVPHAGARSLSLARTNAIGVVLPDLHGEFFSEIVRGMDRVASSSGYLLLLSNMHGRREQAALAMRAMHGRVDALVVMAPHLNEDELAAALPVGLRSMLINTRDASGKHPSIHHDNQA